MLYTLTWIEAHAPPAKQLVMTRMDRYALGRTRARQGAGGINGGRHGDGLQRTFGHRKRAGYPAVLQLIANYHQRIAAIRD